MAVGDERRASRGSTRAALYVGSVAVYADLYISQPLLPLLSREFGVEPAEAGLTVSAVVLAIAVASSFYGPLGDALGRKRVMVGAIGLLAAPTLLCALTRSFAALVAFRALQGILIPGVTAVSVAYIGDEFEAREVPPVVGGLIAASVTGGLAGRVGSGAVAAHFGWRASFAVFAATTICGAILMAIALPARPAGARMGWGRAYRGMFAHFRDRSLVGAFLVGMTLFFGFIGIFTYLPYRLSAEPFRLGTGPVSSVYLVYLAGVVTSPIAGRLAGRLGAPRLMAVGLTVSILGIAGTLAPSLPVIVVALVVLCTGMFTAQSIAPSFVNLTAREPKGAASALYLGLYYVGGTLGSSLPGLAWQAWRWPGVAAICGGAIGLGLLSALTLCRPAAGARASG
jgi:YNFM family putative membrane transporter